MNIKPINQLIQNLIISKDFDLIESLTQKGILITDHKGIIIQIDEAFYQQYGLINQPLLGRSIFDLEREKIFSPSITKIALQTKKRQTIVQKVLGKMHSIVTAIPLFDSNENVIHVVTFSRDIDEFFELKKIHSQLAHLSTSHPFKNNLNEITFETNNASFKGSINALKKIAHFNINILLLGETGVGKSLLAEKIHHNSHYHNGPFIAINCGAIPHDLIESELFGYKKGAFTGANQDKIGLIESANGGSLFLDEIAELPYHAQVKLLQVLQTKKVRRIGEIMDQNIDFRLISATNRDLNIAVKDKIIREDLFYRLNAFTFTLPPLRDRQEDIPSLIQFYIDKFNQSYDLSREISAEALQYLIHYPWFGNIRELENIVHRLVITTDNSTISINDLCDDLKYPTHIQQSHSKNNYHDIEDLSHALEEYEKTIILNLYEKYRSATDVAMRLNISQPTASRKINKYLPKHS